MSAAFRHFKILDCLARAFGKILYEILYVRNGGGAIQNTCWGCQYNLGSQNDHDRCLLPTDEQIELYFSQYAFSLDVSELRIEFHRQLQLDGLLVELSVEDYLVTSRLKDFLFDDFNQQSIKDDIFKYYICKGQDVITVEI